jgi:hypothetical protein
VQKVSREARQEIIEALRQRYGRATKSEKGRILDEFTSLSRCHRKHAIRLLRESTESELKPASKSRRVYDEAVKTALLVIWETADRICGKRLKAALPNLIRAMEKYGHLGLEPEVRSKLLLMSPATVDRMLNPIRTTAGIRKKRRAANKASKGIATKTFSDWKDPVAGHVEIDFTVVP